MGNVYLKLCEDVLTDEHHCKALSLRETVATVYTVSVLHLKNDHCGLVEVSGDLVEVFHSFNRLKRTTDSVVDYVARAKSEVNVRSLLSKDRRKKRSARNETKVNGYAVFLSEVIINEVSDNLRLISTGRDPNLNAILSSLVCKRAHTVVVTEEALYEARELVPECLEEVSVCLGRLCVSTLNNDAVKRERLSLSVSEPRTERTDVCLQLAEVLCNLVLVLTHIAEKVGNVLKSCGHRALG